MPRPYPTARIGLKAFLEAAGISKNTFFLRYRHKPQYIVLLDIEEDRDHRLHFPSDAGEKLRLLRGKKVHGNRGRRPRHACPRCAVEAHPRHASCHACDFQFRPAEMAPPLQLPSTAERNGSRRDELRRAKQQASTGDALDQVAESAITEERKVAASDMSSDRRDSHR